MLIKKLARLRDILLVVAILLPNVSEARCSNFKAEVLNSGSGEIKYYRVGDKDTRILETQWWECSASEARVKKKDSLVVDQIAVTCMTPTKEIVQSIAIGDEQLFVNGAIHLYGKPPSSKNHYSISISCE